MATPAHAHIEPRAAVSCLRRVALSSHERLPLPLPLQALLSLRHRLRQPVLIARSTAANLSHHTDDPTLSLSDMEQQDLLLCERLQALLALHGRHLCASSPTRTLTGIVPPACAPSVLLSGSAVMDLPKFLPLSTPARPAPLRFITTLRARFTSRGSTGSNGTGLEMPALVVTLLLRRPEGKGQTGAVTKRMFVPLALKLRVAS